MEVIPESYYIMSTKDDAPNGRCQVSYWEKAFQLAGLPEISNTNNHCNSSDIDALIMSLRTKVLNDSGSLKFPLLTSLFKVVASVSHGNSAPENGFCINKYLIQLHGGSVVPDTIEAWRFVKDTILSYGSIIDIPITKSLLESAKLA